MWKKLLKQLQIMKFKELKAVNKNGRIKFEIKETVELFKNQQKGWKKELNLGGAI